jgi:two-component system cell cycle response regulator
MSARVLVVDDIPANVKLLEAKLTSEYFDVISARNGPEALTMIRDARPDLVLLDVMMPGMDGFEVCRKIKLDPAIAHTPVIMVTALDQVKDRVTGLEAGADDFLTKPVVDVALFARVRSLVRLKMMTDELRLREDTGKQLGLPSQIVEADNTPLAGARILIVEDRQLSAERLVAAFGGRHDVRVEANIDEAGRLLRDGSYDLAIISLALREADGLRLVSHLRSEDATRQIPVLVLVQEGDMNRLARALDIGANDYLMRPVDNQELLARARTQLRRKRYADRLREHVSRSMALAVTDPLTGLFNRRYMTSHLESTLNRAAETGKPASLMVLDIDYFKSINDSLGHGAGDAVLREFASRIGRNIRGFDLACRYGGEEFVVVMPDTDGKTACMVAERLRRAMALEPFDVSTGPPIDLTVSIGVAACQGAEETSEYLIERADKALYTAKREGRDRVIAAD